MTPFLQNGRPVLPLIAIGLATAALAGCSTILNHPLPEPIAIPVAEGIDGEWLSADGSSATRFFEGAFRTAALDTGEILAEGAYAITDETNVSITMKSLIRRKTGNVNCLLVHTSQLNCTTEDRRQFVLTRAPASAPAVPRPTRRSV